MSLGEVIKPQPAAKADPKETWRRHETLPGIEINGEDPPKWRTRSYQPKPVYTKREPRP